MLACRDGPPSLDSRDSNNLRWPTLSQLRPHYKEWILKETKVEVGRAEFGTRKAPTAVTVRTGKGVEKEESAAEFEAKDEAKKH